MSPRLLARCRARTLTFGIAAAVAVAATALAGTHDLGRLAVRGGGRGVSASLVVACAAGMTALDLLVQARRRWRIAHVLRGASWHHSANAVVRSGPSAGAGYRWNLDGTARWYRRIPRGGVPWDHWVTEAPEWAGDIDGDVVLRAPGGARLALFRLIP